MSDTLRVTVLSPYPFHMFVQAHELLSRGVLDRAVTAVPASRTGLPYDKVYSRLRWSAPRRVLSRVRPASDPALTRKVIRDFDSWARGVLGKPTLLSALSGFSTETLAWAAAEGIKTCCDRGSWHILEQKRVLDEEAERIGVPPVVFDAFIVERELREYEMVDRITIPSETARRSFIRRGVNPQRVVRVPYGVDVSAFRPSHGLRTAGAIVSVAAVGLRKGHHHLVAAFESLGVPNATLTLVGSISPGWDQRLRLDRPNIRATGRVTRAQVIAELQRASVFVLASVEEGLALVIAQAMACGLPIIATEATGVGELVVDGVEGLTVPATDAEAHAAAIESLLTDPERAADMGAAARRKAISLGGWERYGDQILASMHEVLAGCSG